jgi:hypothetical protein
VIGGIHRKNGTDCLALFGGEFAGKSWRIDDLLTLVGGHLAEICDGVNHETSAGNRGPVQLLHRAVPLLLLLRAQAFQTLNSVEHPAALLRIHVVETAEHVEPVLLHLRGKFAEAGLVLESSLLVWQGEIAVALHPLLEVLLALCGTGAIWRRPECGRRLRSPDFSFRFGTLRGTILLYDGRRRRGFWIAETGESRRDGKQNKRRAETEPGWEEQFHIKYGTLNRAATARR